MYKINIFTIELKLKRLFFLLIVFNALVISSFAQNTNSDKDSIATPDSLQQKTRTDIKSPIVYTAKDSVVFSLPENKVYLYGETTVKQDDLELKAAYMEIDWNKNTIYATTMLDSNGREVGKPDFAQGSEKFQAKSMTYNFKSKRGVIHGVFTEQNGGFLHSETTKRQTTGEINIAKGKYTTCNAENPHYYFALTKAKVFPNDKIISGPLYFVIEDLPIPVIGLPFAYIPDFKKQNSGFMIPSYGEEKRRGFYLQNGGYYFAINQYVDLSVTGSVFSRGTWSMNAASRYVRKYKYNGNFNFQYSRNVVSEEGLADYSNSKSWSLRWNHSQDPKASPNSTFSASVEYQTNQHERQNATSYSSYLDNSKTSSISYQRRFPNTPFNFSANMTANQNSQNKQVNMSLPVMTLNMNRIFPFKRKKQVGESRWYEKIGVSYSSNFKNTITTTDSLLFTRSSISQFKNGFQHSIPISTTFKLLDVISISPSFNYTGRIYFNSVRKHWDENVYMVDSVIYNKGRLVTDTIRGVNHVYDFNFSVPFNTKIYGYFYPLFFKNKIEAVRHVMTPSVSFGYRPDFGTEKYGYYRSVTKYTNNDTITEVYSLYENGIFGSPSRGKSGSINFSIDNNVEMKLKSADSTKEATKIKLLDGFGLSTSYNIAADSLKWSNISMRGRTTLFSVLDISFNGTFDPYAHSSKGQRIDKPLWKTEHKLARLMNFSASTGFTITSETLKKKKDPKTPPKGRTTYHSVTYDEYKVPWSFRVDYSYTFTNVFVVEKKRYEGRPVHSLRFSGNMTLTPKWRVTFNSAYDFENKEFMATSFNLSRDLHCWEMTMNIIPFGRLQSYNFQINIKSNILQDLKYKKSKSWYDN